MGNVARKRDEIYKQRPEVQRLFRRLELMKKIILKNLTEIGREGVDWIHQANDRDQGVAVVNTITKLQLVQHQSAAFLTS